MCPRSTFLDGARVAFKHGAHDVRNRQQGNQEEQGKGFDQRDMGASFDSVVKVGRMSASFGRTNANEYAP